MFNQDCIAQQLISEIDRSITKTTTLTKWKTANLHVEWITLTLSANQRDGEIHIDIHGPLVYGVVWARWYSVHSLKCRHIKHYWVTDADHHNPNWNIVRIQTFWTARMCCHSIGFCPLLYEFYQTFFIRQSQNKHILSGKHKLWLACMLTSSNHSWYYGVDANGGRPVDPTNQSKEYRTVTTSVKYNQWYEFGKFLDSYHAMYRYQNNHNI